MRTAPAQPMHDTDQESSWCRGTVWSLASKAKTDWWKTTRQRSTKTPGENIVKGQTLARVFCMNNSYHTIQQNAILLTSQQWDISYVKSLVCFVWTDPTEWSTLMLAWGRRGSLYWETSWCISPPSPSGKGWRGPTWLLLHSDLHRERGQHCFYELWQSLRDCF